MPSSRPLQLQVPRRRERRSAGRTLAERHDSAGRVFRGSRPGAIPIGSVAGEVCVCDTTAAAVVVERLINITRRVKKICPFQLYSVCRYSDVINGFVHVYTVCYMYDVCARNTRGFRRLHFLSLRPQTFLFFFATWPPPPPPLITILLLSYRYILQLRTCKNTGMYARSSFREDTHVCTIRPAYIARNRK